MLNVIENDRLERQLARVSETLANVELFFVGHPISTARIIDASITTAKIANLSVTNGKFKDLSITNAEITNIDAEKFTAGFLNVARIGANSIVADKLDVDDLSAISADVGTITAGTITSLTITGGTLRTASSGTRAELSSSGNSLIFYNVSSVTVKIDPNGILLNGVRIDFIASESPTFKSRFVTGSDYMQMLAYTPDLVIGNTTSGGDIQFVAANGEIRISGIAVNVNGSPKSAIVPTSSGYNALYCLEAPEVWFFDFAKNEKEIDSVFLESTEGEKNILKTDQDEILVFRKRKGHSHKRFEGKTLEQFNRNNHFWGNHGIK